MKEYKYRINGNPYTVKVGDIDNNLAKVEVNGVPYKVELEKTEKPVTIVSKPRPSAAPRTDTGAKVITKAPVSASGFQVKAPLPGVVMSVQVKVGDNVKASDTVVMLEAMKMEN
ncbi:biotin/lipoyl-containing protein, partial [uncultured Duncaniella sp.]